MNATLLLIVILAVNEPPTEEDIDHTFVLNVCDNDDEDVLLGVDHTDSLVAHSSLLQDYLCRGPFLNNLCLWDYISHIQKV